MVPFYISLTHQLRCTSASIKKVWTMADEKAESVFSNFTAHSEAAAKKRISLDGALAAVQGAARADSQQLQKKQQALQRAEEQLATAQKHLTSARENFEKTCRNGSEKWRSDYFPAPPKHWPPTGRSPLTLASRSTMSLVFPHHLPLFLIALATPILFFHPPPPPWATYSPLQASPLSQLASPYALLGNIILPAQSSALPEYLPHLWPLTAPLCPNSSYRSLPPSCSLAGWNVMKPKPIVQPAYHDRTDHHHMPSPTELKPAHPTHMLYLSTPSSLLLWDAGHRISVTPAYTPIVKTAVVCTGHQEKRLLRHLYHLARPLHPV